MIELNYFDVGVIIVVFVAVYLAFSFFGETGE